MFLSKKKSIFPPKYHVEFGCAVSDHGSRTQNPQRAVFLAGCVSYPDMYHRIQGEGSPGGAPLAPKIVFFFKIMQFRPGENPYFEQILGSGQNSTGPPWPKSWIRPWYEPNLIFTEPLRRTLAICQRDERLITQNTSERFESWMYLADLAANMCYSERQRHLVIFWWRSRTMCWLWQWTPKCRSNGKCRTKLTELEIRDSLTCRWVWTRLDHTWNPHTGTLTQLGQENTIHLATSSWAWTLQF